MYLDRESEAVNPDKESDERYDDVGVSRPSFHSPTGAPSAEDCYHWTETSKKINHKFATFLQFQVIPTL